MVRQLPKCFLGGVTTTSPGLSKPPSQWAGLQQSDRGSSSVVFPSCQMSLPRTTCPGGVATSTLD
ncbi:rCG46211 [Rattus norvegicus]|uniref:RCG46211 n=1 Tax=Rattus norvegicus TaxID=10116 RepID=A6ICQ6_RAT|nr:rCG46211 [Rattus norvegicus]